MTPQARRIEAGRREDQNLQPSRGVDGPVTHRPTTTS